ncbi:MAG: nickel pincer cofactor biosynthesis protein LarC [Proteobacteria bacterium]|nr:nickel pincer cofactor biosynthesis protein LarC [Pseudomonadota bacterium]
MSVVVNTPAQSSTHKHILHFDCFSGLAGDMILAALIDLGLPLEVIESATAKLPLSGYRIRVEKEKRQSIIATRFYVDVEESKQPHRHFADIRKMIEDADLDEAVKSRALKIFHLIAEAEARVHGSSVDKVHFHEVGAVDSIIDIVGAAAALNHMDARVTCSPIPVGRGMIQTAHGVLPVPAPATLFILEGVPVEGTEIEAELTTPTGAAVIKSTAQSFGGFPAMIPSQIGFGAGARSHDTRPGLLRVVLGRPIAEGTIGSDSACFVIEANVDDMTGEIAANAASRLLEAGALDAWFESIQMKKGRPALKLGLLCRNADLNRLSGILFHETSTIGLRYYPVGRIEMKRSMHVVETPYGPIKVKVARGPDGSANAAPEFDDCSRVAAEHGVPVKRIIAIAAGLAQKLIE